MNNLNSLILEGDIDGFEMVNDVLDFDIIVHRSYKNNQGERVSEDDTFACFAYGELAERAYKEFKLGKQVRIVGRIHQIKSLVDEENSEVVVVCECISFD